MDDARFHLEDRIEMLRYSVEAMERQRDGFAPGSLEWHYAQKIIDSCLKELTEQETVLKQWPPTGENASKG